MNIPKELKYSKSHEYLKTEENKTGVLGITAYAASELGDIVYIELPEIGASFNAGDKFGVIESVKSVSDLYVPCACKIVEVNPELNEHPEYVNQDPYGKGWMLKVEITANVTSSKDLISAEEYEKFVLAETH
ncbi:MAG: glycine cleavage system protein GcvH [Candidatus Melainabacteria bacterium]|nr:glycine cleavage system protein GcvH [Candidatus Melainabacteria bacterium]MBI3308012.1 glycine cleavage system protein GcvH [Candidatus Melainabacteria bacterium]